VILLAAAVEAELAFWVPREGVTTLITGIGPVEASCAVATALARDSYRLVVNAGVAGTLDPAVAIGCGVVVDDEAMEMNLDNGNPLVLPAGMWLVDRASSDPPLVALLRLRGFAAVRGVTVARVTATETTAARLARELGAQVESMEGFAVLRAAERAGVAAVELRGISNRCGERAAAGFDFAAGMAGLARIVDAFFASQP
jgi:futalosine hydrolase